MREKQLTTAAQGHVLTNTNVWSPDGPWIVYDTRSEVAGDVFDGRRIKKVNVITGSRMIRQIETRPKDRQYRHHRPGA